MPAIKFLYLTGIPRTRFKQAWLTGSWDAQGRPSGNWSEVEMDPVIAWDGCPAFAAEVQLDPGHPGPFQWGVRLQAPDAAPVWGIVIESGLPESQERIRSFRLRPQGAASVQQETYYLSDSRRFGAQKVHVPGRKDPGIRFSVWAPNALEVEVVMASIWDGFDPQRTPKTDLAAAQAMLPQPRGQIHGGYLGERNGHHPGWGPFALRPAGDGIWVSDDSDPALASFERFGHAPYMFRIRKDDGRSAYRTDLFSRCQVGFGNHRPDKEYKGNVLNLDGTVSCSVALDPDKVTRLFHEPVWPETRWMSNAGFWSKESRFPSRPRKVEDLVVYELHLGALGFGKADNEPGDLLDAMAFLDHVQELGANAIELLPMSEFGGGTGGWGYATSHHFAIEYSGGGRDKYKWFVRECHRRGISVIMDVVYNHYVHEAERAQWMYDTGSHEKNPYYWYEGSPGDYPGFDAEVPPERRGTGGYLDNLSTAWAPRFTEERVRQLFISSAVMLATEFGVDGFRVDQTTSIHSYARLHADGRKVERADAYGRRFLRELTRALRLVKPDIMLMAEDHSDEPGVTLPPEQDGLGFDLAWYSDFYHHLVGDGERGPRHARLLRTAGFGDDRPLAMDYFAGALAHSGNRKLVYGESHDEAGNGKETDRNVRVAVNGAPLVGMTRRYAEARCRFVAGVTLLSAGIPMIFFGEEVCAEKPFLYGRVLQNREDITELRRTTGRGNFEFHRSLIRLRTGSPALKGNRIEVLLAHNQDRLLAFRRWDDAEEYLVVASLANRPYVEPAYGLSHPSIPAGSWREVLNSDSPEFGGDGVGNPGSIRSGAGYFECRVPANGVVVLRKGH